MYTTCAFCNSKLDGDGGPSGLGVGRRIAYDEWQARLWVICPRCARWNLTPFDDRLERIETVARAASSGRVAAATEQISLIRWQRYDFVRVGKPPRAELAHWRYGERLAQRSRDRMKVLVPLTIGAVAVGVAANVALGGGLGVVVMNLHNFTQGIYTAIIGNKRVALVEPPVCARCGEVMTLRAKHVQHARLIPESSADLALLLSCPRCRSEGALVTGDAAAQVLRQGLTYLNVNRSSRRHARDAAHTVDAAGGAPELIREVSKREATLRSLKAGRRLALEMAIDEQAELLELERQWREAEELADIADGTLSGTTDLDRQIDDIKNRGENQPPG